MSWSPWKLIVANLAITLTFFIFNAAAGLLLPWLGISAVISVCFLVAVGCNAGLLVYVCLRWPGTLEWEEEIVVEATIHQELWLFRISWWSGLIVLLAIGIYLRFTWVFHLGFCVTGSLLWLYFFDIALEIYGNWGEVWEIITSEPEHALKMVASGLLVLLLATAVSLWYYGDITQPDQKITTPTESYWQKAKGYVKKGWDYLQKQWQSTPVPQKQR